jgi:diphosphomevalonate decarboxylase
MICIVSDKKKETSSSAGMQTSVATSELMKTRIDDVVPRRIETIKTAILNRDFEKFAEITMRESNQFHAICMDTFPPISYLTDVSRRIIHLVHVFNECGVKLAYTFDAGPNAVVYSIYPEALDAFEAIVGKEFGKDEVGKVLRSKIGNGPEVVG